MQTYVALCSFYDLEKPAQRHRNRKGEGEVRKFSFSWGQRGLVLWGGGNNFLGGGSYSSAYYAKGVPSDKGGFHPGGNYVVKKHLLYWDFCKQLLHRFFIFSSSFSCNKWLFSLAWSESQLTKTKL